MDILLWIVFGLVVGLVAKLIMPGHDPGGIILTVVLGIVGAMLGGWLGRVMGLYREGEAAGFIMAVVGAIIVLGLYRLVMPPAAAACSRRSGRRGPRAPSAVRSQQVADRRAPVPPAAGPARPGPSTPRTSPAGRPARPP